jgi:hypothetical protein
MTVISISITESSEQIVAGIPKTVILAANNSAIIYYTLDGTVPTTLSNIYVSPIRLAYDQLIVILNILASNGTDPDVYVTETYVTNVLNNARLPHSATDAAAGVSMASPYPFGNDPIQPNGTYLNPGDASITVDNPAKPEISTGFDGAGNQVGFTNEPYNLENYSIVYSTTDNIGQTGYGIGNLPADVKIKQQKPAPEYVDQSSNVFDPRASVIFQDTTTENPDDPPHINRQFFSLEDPERIRDGNNYYNTGLDAPPVTGAFVRSHYNPKDQTITYYYRDNIANKWIISKTPYIPTGTWDGNLTGVRSSRSAGAGFVFEWIPGARRVLF